MADICVGVTDRGWFQHLRSLPAPDEVNFWHPSAGAFQSLLPGGLFLFKLRYPDNAIVGGGFFAHHSIWPLSTAWDTFADKDGAATLEAPELASDHPDVEAISGTDGTGGSQREAGVPDRPLTGRERRISADE